MGKITVIQARMSSTRLPGKVMKPILDMPLIGRMIERVKKSELCGTIVVATSSNPSDKPILDYCESIGIDTFPGDENDLLDRHYQCALHYKADTVAKIPSDCPLIDHRIIDRVFSYYDENRYDYVSNLHPASYPDGNDVEIMTIEALKKAHEEALKPMEREHTTPYFWEHPELFSLGNVSWKTGKNFSMSHRFTIDYPEDFEFIRNVYEELYPEIQDFTMEDILKLIERKPEIYEINAKYAGVNWYRNHLDELGTIDESQTKKL